MTDQEEPDRPQAYMAQFNTPDSTKALNTPLYPVIARNPPPEPITAIVGTWNEINASLQHNQHKKYFYLNQIKTHEAAGSIC